MKSQTASAQPTAPGVTWDGWVRQQHDKSAGSLRESLQGLHMDESARMRMLFAFEQWIAATHPDNFLATNPDALSLAMQSEGKSLQNGLQRMLADVARGRVSNTDETAFEVGSNIAATPGKVVLRNDLIERGQRRLQWCGSR